MRRPARLPPRPLGEMRLGGERCAQHEAPLPESWRLGPEVGKLLAMPLQASRQQALHPQLADWLGKADGPGA
ncbi:hypothetical protein [Chromobacterium vaccinii]|uniref:hypothetical protein n=1 Tax=Chromobacterium vaccinii TaxID=1108595 RepID=UPI001E5B3042|nr:hypothetical protein [Chromobacterium vaccinii]MCD4498905.1 hypothetical protein [Chromobacterium vaccinii]